MKKITLFTTLFLVSFLFLQFVWRVSADTQQAGKLSAEKVNLALRRTAHHLLAEAGDSTSAIPPVVATAGRSWQIQMDHAFNYERLPVLLQASFELHGIQDDYDVAVLSCVDNELQLGYNFLDFSKSRDVPCGGRNMASGCYKLQVTFPVAQSRGFPVPGLIVVCVMGLAVFWLGRRRTAPVNVRQVIPEANHWLHFGQSRLDVTNQLLLCGIVRHELTYRETKLLHLFVAHSNQLLERSYILQNVWADEGILVGRSADMFVSRLRKMLRDDASVSLVAVHGVGYRMEVV